MSGILINGVSKTFDSVVALKRVDLEVEEGEFLVLLGASGSGKTTMLRCVAGLEAPSAGEVHLHGKCVFAPGVDVPPKERSVGFVFQNGALYPHMTVYRNVAFAASMRGVPPAQLDQRVREALRLAELEGFEERRPRQLSGGQQQRVAVARIIAAQPQTLLFDEPLSNLDPRLRVSLRDRLKELHRRLGASSLYVTHDPPEAMALADRIAVMVKGQIEQVGTADAIYHSPASASVAEITGDVQTNLLEGELHRAPEGMLFIPRLDPFCFIRLDEEYAALAGQQVVLHVRPEDVQILPTLVENEGRLKVLAVMPRGSDTLVHLRLGEHMGQVLARAEEAEATKLKPGREVRLRFRRCNIFDAESRKIVRSFGDPGALPALSGEIPAALQ